MNPLPSVIYTPFLDLAVCNDKSCQHALKVDSISRHLRQVHKVSNEAAAEIQSKIQAEQAPLPGPIPVDKQLYLDTTNASGTPTIRPTSSKAPQNKAMHPLALPALPFLPIMQCIQCSECGVIKKSKDAMKRHLRDCLISTIDPVVGANCSAPPEGAVQKPQTISVLAQSIFGGKSTAWFPVITEESGTIHQLLQQDQGSAPASSQEETPVPHLDSFLSEMRFDVQLQQMYKLSMEEAFQAAQWCSRPPLPYARKILAAYLHNAFTVAAQKSYIKSHTVLNSPLRLSLSTETLRTYIARLSRLLTFLFTLSDWPEAKRVKFMTNAQQAEVKEFSNLCRSGSANLTPAVTKFHVIIRSIMFDPLDNHQTVLPMFIACSAVKRCAANNSYRFGNANETSPILAALKYLVKCATVTHVYAFPRSATDREDAWKQLSAATSQYADSGATVVANTLRSCHRLAASESHNINMVLCTRHPMCGIVDGHEISLTQLAFSVHRLQKNAWSLLQEKLLMGLNLNTQFWTMLGALQDALGERSTGYWYLMHPNNYDQLNAWRRAYVNAVHPHLFSSDASVQREPAEQFIKNAITFRNQLYTLMQVCSGGPARATEAAVLRIRNTAKATRGLFVSQGQLLSILTYTKTRCMQDGTGKTIVRCPDSVTAGMMHIYLVLIHPLHILLSAQIENQSAGITTDRAVASDTGSVPMQPPPSSGDTANPLDFMFDTSSSSPDRLRSAFTACLDSVDIPLNTTQYRHYHSAVLKHFLPSAATAWQNDVRYDEEDSASSATLHLQAGHTEHTATKKYGVTRSQLTAITATELQMYRNASQTWHRILRLPSGSPIPFTEKRDPGTFGIGAQSHQQQNRNAVLPLPNPDTPNSSNTKPTEQSANGGMSTKDLLTTGHIFSRLDCIENSLGIILAKFDGQSLLPPATAVGAPDPRSTFPSRQPESNIDISNGTGGKRKSPSSSSDHCAHDSATAASLSLQTFLQCPEAQFRSSQQKSAVLHALQPVRDQLVVLPTGSGKSLLFMLPAFVKPDRVCVVVVPLVSLQQDLIQRCAEKGITAAQFPEAVNTPGVRIVLVSAEHVVLPSYAAFLRTAAATQTLHAIFADEAHLFVLWRSFRTALQDVCEFIRPHDITVPIIAMTATCPPVLEERVSRACGMQRWQVLRSPTTRPNIKYSVKQVAASNMLLSAAQLIARIAVADSSTNVNGGNNSPQTRMILYIQNKARCNAVVHVFSLICPQVHCLVYHSDLTDAQRSDALHQWKASRSTKPRLMVATSAFGCGIDVPSVRCVLHLGLPTTVIDFLQESGRAGRDGLPAQSVIIHQPLASAKCKTGSHVQSDGESRTGGGDNNIDDDAVRFGQPTSLCTTAPADCRRWFLDSFADGIVDRRSCQNRLLEPCDHCSELCGNADSTWNKRRKQEQVQGPAGPSSDSQVGGDRSQHGMINPATVTNSGTGLQQGQYHSSSLNAAGTVTATTESLQEQHQPSTPAQLRELAEHLADSCPPCSVSTETLVRHKTQSNACFRNICLRCCASGHKASLCPNLSLPPNATGCYTCTLNTINGMIVHNAGTYGKRSCMLKQLFCYCICMWENPRLRSQIQNQIPGTQAIQTTTEFVHWLRNGVPSGEKSLLGILHMATLVQAFICK